MWTSTPVRAQHVHNSTCENMYAEENKKTQDFLRNQINKLFSYEALCLYVKLLGRIMQWVVSVCIIRYIYQYAVMCHNIILLQSHLFMEENIMTYRPNDLTSDYHYIYGDG
jgi:hypothetical protein